ncbi:MAG: TIGR02710 family CRISPR-associated CARF protein [Phycisphaerae bacterium]
MTENTRTVLVATVGTGRYRKDIASAIVLSARQNDASKVLLLSSPQSSAETVPLVRDQLADLDIREQVCTDGREDNVQSLFMDWSAHWEEWLSGWLPARVVVDFTSGTKPMSAAAFALAISREADGVSYVVGPRDRTGRATESTAAVCFAPELVVGRQQLRLAAEHFNAGSFAAARDIAASYMKCDQMPDETLRTMARGLHYIAAGYEAWDRFDWKQARSYLHQVISDCSEWQWLHTPDQLRQNYSLLTEIKKHSGQQGFATWILADLLSNARRCMDREDWDDAVARLYRACEMVAQKRLLEQYRQKTGDIDPDTLPDELREEYRRRKDNAARGKLALGLEASYRLLEQLGDELGRAFREVYGAEGKGELASLLAARNQSLLAHGEAPIRPEKAEKLWGQVVGLANTFWQDELAAAQAQTKPVRFVIR